MPSQTVLPRTMDCAATDGATGRCRREVKSDAATTNDCRERWHHRKRCLHDRCHRGRHRRSRRHPDGSMAGVPIRPMPVRLVQLRLMPVQPVPPRPVPPRMWCRARDSVRSTTAGSVASMQCAFSGPNSRSRGPPTSGTKLPFLYPCYKYAVPSAHVNLVQPSCVPTRPAATIKTPPGATTALLRSPLCGSPPQVVAHILRMSSWDVPWTCVGHSCHLDGVALAKA